MIGYRVLRAGCSALLKGAWIGYGMRPPIGGGLRA